MTTTRIPMLRRLPAKEDPVVITPPPVVVVPPKLVGIALSTLPPVNEGSSGTLALSGIYEGGTVALISSGITWPAIAPNGVFSPPANSVVGDSYEVTITAQYGGFTASRVVQVVDRSVVVTPPTGERITGVLPVDVNFDLVSLQNPPQPTISTLFSAPIDQPVAPPDYYGAMFDPADVRHSFAPGANPLVKELWFGRYQGDLSGRYFRVFGESADGTLTQLVNFAPIPGDPNLPAFVPGKGYVFPVAAANYVGLYYSVKGNAKPWSFRVYAEYTPIPARAKPPITKYPLRNHMGFNVHPPALLHPANDPSSADAIPAEKVALLQHFSSPRLYLNCGNFNPQPGLFQYEQDTQGNNLDALMQGLYKIHGSGVISFENLTPDLYATYPNNGNYERVPIPYGASQTDPAAWQTFRNTIIQPVYRWGDNPNVPQELVFSRTGFFSQGDQRPEKQWVKRIGLGWATEVEIPVNEFDKYWKGPESFLTPAGGAVGCGVLYDAIKQYNPNMKVSLGGLASFSPDWIAEFVRECRIRRGVDAQGNVRIPCDKYQVHFYPTTGGSQYSNEPTVGVTIENSYGPALVARFADFNYYKLGNKPTGIGEINRDATTNSPIRAVVPAGSTLTQRQWIAVCSMRDSLWDAKNGFEYTKHYEYEDNSPTNMYTQFSAMGFFQVLGTPPNAYVQPWPIAYALGQLYDLCTPTIRHAQEINASPLVDKWQDDAGRIMYSLYLPTESNATGTYALTLPNGGTRYDFSYDSFTPKTTTLAPGTATLPLTETPCFVVLNPAT
jgi:hypothetical protein